MEKSPEQIDTESEAMCRREAQKAIAWRTDCGTRRLFVCDTPHRKGSKTALAKGVDWGYTIHRAQALELSPYWQRRFIAHCKYVNGKGFTLPV